VAPWAPAPPMDQQLRALVTARETLVQERLRLRNRQHAAGYTASEALVTELQAPVLAVIEAQIAHIDRELTKLGAADTILGAPLRIVVTIPGLGLTTAGALLASLPLDRLQTPRQVAAYVGLCPHERTSGSSVRGRTHIGPLGPASLRKALYMPAIVAMRANPALRVFAERLHATVSLPRSSSPPSCASSCSWPGQFCEPANRSRPLTGFSSSALDVSRRYPHSPAAKVQQAGRPQAPWWNASKPRSRAECAGDHPLLVWAVSLGSPSLLPGAKGTSNFSCPGLAARDLRWCRCIGPMRIRLINFPLTGAVRSSGAWSSIPTPFQARTARCAPTSTPRPLA
jgi:Transposase IS116/IS110/IS902 family